MDKHRVTFRGLAAAIASVLAVVAIEIIVAVVLADRRDEESAEKGAHER